MTAGDIHIQGNIVGLFPLTSLPVLWASDTIKLAFINSSTTPSIIDSNATWGSAGAQDYSVNEVSGGNVPAGGITLAGTSVSTTGAVTSLLATNPIQFASNSSNPSNARWGVIYDDTDTDKHVFGYLDLGGVTDLRPGFSWNLNNNPGSGTQPVFTLTAA